MCAGVGPVKRRGDSWPGGRLHSYYIDFRNKRPAYIQNFLENLVNWCGDLLANEGEFLAMKGQFPDDEVAALPAGWQVKSSHSLDVPGADGERHLLVVARAANSE